MDNLKTDRIALLREIANLLHIIGSANDAEDHSYLRDARQMRKDAGFALKKIIAEEPDLVNLLPGLREELKTGHIYGSGWYDLLDVIERQLNPSEK